MPDMDNCMFTGNFICETEFTKSIQHVHYFIYLNHKEKKTEI